MVAGRGVRAAGVACAARPEDTGPLSRGGSCLHEPRRGRVRAALQRHGGRPFLSSFAAIRLPSPPPSADRLRRCCTGEVVESSPPHLGGSRGSTTRSDGALDSPRAAALLSPGWVPLV